MVRISVTHLPALHVSLLCFYRAMLTVTRNIWFLAVRQCLCSKLNMRAHKSILVNIDYLPCCFGVLQISIYVTQRIVSLENV